METPACAGCGARPLDEIARLRGLDRWSDGAAEGVRLLRCPACDLGQVHPRAEPARLRSHYETGYLSREATRRRLATGRAQLFRAYLDRLVREAPGRRLLDVGCGQGDFLAEARAAGWEPLGLELHKGAAEMGAARGVRILEGSVEALAGVEEPFHAITLWNVLDQMPDPAAELRALLPYLAPGGALFVRVPNRTFHLAAWRLWRLILPHRPPPTVFHPLVFSARSLRAFLERAGLAEVKVESSLMTESPVPGLPAPAARIARALVWVLTLLTGVGPSLVAWARGPAEPGRSAPPGPG